VLNVAAAACQAAAVPELVGALAVPMYSIPRICPRWISIGRCAGFVQLPRPTWAPTALSPYSSRSARICSIVIGPFAPWV
jgi:hypothetical protein